MQTNGAGKRSLIEPHTGDKRYVQRDGKGPICTEVDVVRSLAVVAKQGQGDNGDQKTRRAPAKRISKRVDS